MTSSLVLHKGAQLCSLAELGAAPTPGHTRTHYPIPHHELWVRTTRTLGDLGFGITHEQHSMTPDQSSYFGVLDLDHQSVDYCVSIGLRNDHNKRFPASLAVGSHVFACDNLAFSAQLVVSRKHTRFVNRDLDRLVVQALGKLGNHIKRQEQQFEAYKQHNLTFDQARSLLVQCIKANVMGCTNLPDALKSWENPPENASDAPTVWRFFNVITDVGKRWAPPLLVKRTQLLHGLCDSAVGFQFEPTNELTA